MLPQEGDASIARAARAVEAFVIAFMSDRQLDTAIEEGHKEERYRQLLLAERRRRDAMERLARHELKEQQEG